MIRAHKFKKRCMATRVLSSWPAAQCCPSYARKRQQTPAVFKNMASFCPNSDYIKFRDAAPLPMRSNPQVSRLKTQDSSLLCGLLRAFAHFCGGRRSLCPHRLAIERFELIQQFIKELHRVFDGLRRGHIDAGEFEDVDRIFAAAGGEKLY